MLSCARHARNAEAFNLQFLSFSFFNLHLERVKKFKSEEYMKGPSISKTNKPALRNESNSVRVGNVNESRNELQSSSTPIESFCK